MEFSRQEYWSRLPFPTPGNLNNPKIKPTSPALPGRFFTTEPAAKSTMEYYSAIKTNERMPFEATQMDQEIVILSEVRKTNNIWCHLFVESKLWLKWTYLLNNHGHRGQTRQLSKGRQGGRRTDWELGVSRFELLHIGWINNKVLLYSTGPYINILDAP